jgi:hypothetical protein
MTTGRFSSYAFATLFAIVGGGIGGNANAAEHHPVVVINEDDVLRTRTLLKTDDQCQVFYSKLQKEAKRLEKLPCPKRVLTPDLVPVAREYLHRFEVFGALYLLDGDQRWINAARPLAESLEGFVDWNPPHFLEVAEICQAMSIAYDWMYDGWTPGERASFLKAIDQKSLQPALKEYANLTPESEHWWTTSDVNWNVVCNAGVIIGAAITKNAYPDDSHSVETQGLASIAKGMTSYSTDGGWPEGMAYWQFATRYAVPMMATLKNVEGTDGGLVNSPGMSSLSFYRLANVAPSGEFFEFADSNEKYDLGFPWLHWIGRQLNDPAAHYAAANHADGTDPLDLLWYEPNVKAPQSLPLDAFFPRLPTVLMRSSWSDPNATFLGAYGGNNSESGHAHLEMGNFELEALGERWISKLGGDSYGLPGYFEKTKRFKYMRTRTAGQNVVQLNGADQPLTGRGKQLSSHSDPDSGNAVFDLSSGYQNVKRVWRGYMISGPSRSVVTIQDEVYPYSDVECTWQVYTSAELELVGNSVVMSKNGKSMTLRVITPSDGRLSIETASPDTSSNDPDLLLQDKNKGYHKVVLHISAKANRANRILVQFLPTAEVPTVPVPEFKLLSQWAK